MLGSLVTSIALCKSFTAAKLTGRKKEKHIFFPTPALKIFLFGFVCFLQKQKVRFEVEQNFFHEYLPCDGDVHL